MPDEIRRSPALSRAARSRRWAATFGTGDWIELVTSLAIVVGCMPNLLSGLHGAATFSLWIDEIDSIRQYSAPGPWTAITKYYAANNHIFFNLVNSITPGAGSYDPFRARLWAMVAVLATLALALHELWRRRWFLAGAVFVFAVTINNDLLDLCLGARGYGFLLFFATAGSLWAARYLETRRRRWLAALAVAVWLGTWTIPIFVFLGGALWLTLLIADRSAKVLKSAAATLAAIVLVYLPVMGQLWTQESTYGQQFGRNYDRFRDVWLTIQTYLTIYLPNLFVVTAFVLLGAVVALARPSLLGRQRRAAAAGWVLLGSAALFFMACLILQTPLVRTTSFVVAPLALGLLVPAAALVRRTGFEVIRPTAAVTAAVLLVPAGVAYRSSHRFLPHEEWRPAAAYVAATFPDGTPAYNQHSPGSLQVYLARRNPLAARFDLDALREGRLVVVAERIGPTPSSSEVTMDKLASSLVSQQFNQQRGTVPRHAMSVEFAPPVDRHLIRAAVGGTPEPALIDGDLSTSYQMRSSPRSTTLELTVAPGTVGRSLVIAGDRVPPYGAMTITTRSPNGTSHLIARNRLTYSAGLLAVQLGGRRGGQHRRGHRRQVDGSRLRPARRMALHALSGVGIGGSGQLGVEGEGVVLGFGVGPVLELDDAELAELLAQPAGCRRRRRAGPASCSWARSWRTGAAGTAAAPATS